jgi:hypothetical protein
MVRLKVKKNKTGILVRAKLSSDEEVSPRELEKLQTRGVPGLLTARQLSRSALEFSGPYTQSLAEHLSRPVGEFEFLRILSQAIDTVIRTHQEGLVLNNLELDLRYVFYNDSNVELSFLYLPLLTNHVYVDIKGFLEALVFSMTADSKETADSIAKCRAFLQKQTAFDARAIKNYINGEIKTLQQRKSARKPRGESGFITDKPRDYYEHYHNGPAGPAGEGTVVLRDGGEETATTVLRDDGDYDGGWPGEETATTVLQSEDGPGGFSEEAATTVLREAGEQNEPEVHYASLQRMKTGEQIELNKPVYRLGKERSYVDYFIGDNNFVSRSHADIITRGRQYFVKDLNSKNGTYIHGGRIQPNIEVELRNGESVLLADEEFVLWT